MPEWSTFVKTYCLEPEHLPNPHGPNVVVIEGLDSEEYTGTENKPQVRHRLWLAGWDVPLRLNNTRVKVLQNILGPRTEDAIGRKIVLTIVAANNYGEYKAAINIHPFAPQPDAPVTPVPARLATRSPLRLATAATYGVSVAPAAFTLPPGMGVPGSTPPGPHAPALTPPNAGAGSGGGGGGAIRPSGQKLGPEFAAKLIVELRKRNWTWERLVAHFHQHGMGALVEAGLPPDCDAALRTPAWSLLRNQPLTVAVDEAAVVQQLIASWTPPPPPPPPAPPAGPAVPKAGEIIDPVSGEVIPTDDIPF